MSALIWAGFATRMTPAPAESVQRVCTRGSVARLAARASGMEFVDVNRFLTLKPGCGTPEFFPLAAEPYCTIPAMVCYAIPYHTIPAILHSDSDFSPVTIPPLFKGPHSAGFRL